MLKQILNLKLIELKKYYRIFYNVVLPKNLEDANTMYNYFNFCLQKNIHDFNIYFNWNIYNLKYEIKNIEYIINDKNFNNYFLKNILYIKDKIILLKSDYLIIDEFSVFLFKTVILNNLLSFIIISSKLNLKLLYVIEYFKQNINNIFEKLNYNCIQLLNLVLYTHLDGLLIFNNFFESYYKIYINTFYKYTINIIWKCFNFYVIIYSI